MKSAGSRTDKSEGMYMLGYLLAGDKLASGRFALTSNNLLYMGCDMNCMNDGMLAYECWYVLAGVVACVRQVDGDDTLAMRVVLAVGN